ncbi:MAG: acyl carrier protein [Litorimonas sp.]
MDEISIRQIVEKELQQGAASGWASFTGGATFAAGVDSLKAIDICLALEEAFGIVIEEANVPPGGFSTDEECTAYFVDKVVKAKPTIPAATVI